MRYRVLKRGRNEPKSVMAYVDMRMSDPLTEYIVDWLRFVENSEESKVFAISRQRAWRIMTEIDPNIWNHWFRHQRLTHASDTMNPWELKEFAKFSRLETATRYVHESPVKLMAKIREADKLWQ